MLKHKRYTLIVVTFSLIGVLAACAPQAQTGASGGMDHGSAKSNAPFDQQFIDMMVPHHEGAVAMARIAQQRGERPEIKQLANAIVGDQEREIGQLKAWRKSWFGSDATPPMNKMPMLAGMQHTMGNIDDDLKRLQTAAPFDRTFIDLMIPHHQDAIAAAKLAQQQATKPEIKQLAQEIVAAQEREIKQMQEWRKAWYGA